MAKSKKKVTKTKIVRPKAFDKLAKDGVELKKSASCWMGSMVLTEKLVGISFVNSDNFNSEGNLEKLISFLKDSNEEIVSVAITKLNELSFKESIASLLAREDLFQNLMDILLQFNSDWKPLKTSETCLKINILADSFSLLSNLCEVSDEMLQNIVQQDFHSFCLRHLCQDFQDSKVALVAAQTLYKMAVDNPQLVQKLNKEENIKYIFEQMNLPFNNSQFLSFKGACLGILIHTISPQDLGYESCMQIALGHSAQILIAIYSSFNISLETEKISNYESLKELIRGKTFTLGIISDMLHINKEIDLIDSEVDLSDIEFASQEETMEKSDSILLPQIQCHNILENISNYAIHFPKDLADKWELDNELDAELLNLKGAALICLQSMLDFYGVSILSNSDQWFQFMDELIKLILVENQETNILEGALLNVQSLLNISTYFQVVYPQLLEAIQKLSPIAIKHQTNINIVTSIIRIFSLVVLCEIKNNNCNTLKDISLIIINVAFTHTSIDVLVECLDCLIDMFSEDITISLAKELDLANKIVSLRKIFNNKLKQTKISLKPEVMDTVQNNLKPFVDYLKTL